VVAARGGEARRVTSLAGDERWPSWTPDGRLVFAHRRADRWDLRSIGPIGSESAGEGAPVALTETPGTDEREPRVSNDGERVAFVSDRESDTGDPDLWVMGLPGPGAAVSGTGADRRRRPQRVTAERGDEALPSWSPAGDRIAYFAVRDGVGSVWVSDVPPVPSRGETGEDDEEGSVVRSARPLAPAVLVSRRGGAPAWSPDGSTILIAALPAPQPTYNGNPLRNRQEAPPLFVPDAFALWSVAAPAPADAGLRALVPDGEPAGTRWTAAFDRVWRTLRDLYYSAAPQAVEWEALRDRYRTQAASAPDPAAFEDVVDRMIAEQPLIKPPVTSRRAVVVSGHPLASQAGADAIASGGNIVDAAIAVSFALGVVEPEASGIGGDGMAVLYLKGMREPVVVDYKDMTPSHATTDNPRIFDGGRIISDGPAAANIPGVVAGLHHLYTRYGSEKVAWADLVAPAIRHAEEGFVLDDALPTSLAEGRRFLEKYDAASRIYLPGGEVPKPGDRFVNRDYASTLRAIAEKGGREFYEGDLARRIAADLLAHGGIITFEDLAQYQAVERRPVVGRYRGHLVYSSPPPVPSGASLIETLQILQSYQPKPDASYTTDADYLHYLIEAWKVRDQIRRLADPDRWPVDLEDHLDPAHAARLFARIDPTRASRYRAAGPGEGAAGRTERIGRGTTAFAVADTDGNMIAITQTLSTWGGTFYVSEGLGFLYNNHLRSNRTTPGAFGQMLPLVRSSSTSVPTLLFRGEAPPGAGAGAAVPRLAVAAAGNAWISSSVYEIIVNVVDAGMAMQRAVEAPRFLIGRDPRDSSGETAEVEIEDRVPRRILDDLTARGHRFRKIGRKGEVRYGYAAAVLVDVAQGLVEGGAEPRRSHAAVAPEGRRGTPKVDEVFLLHRDGLLLRHASRLVRKGSDSDILSGLLIAVQNFINESFIGKDWEHGREGLDELNFGKYRIAIVRGKHVVLAAVVSGQRPEEAHRQMRVAMKDIEMAIGPVMEAWDGDMEKVAGSAVFVRDLLAGAYQKRRGD